MKGYVKSLEAVFASVFLLGMLFILYPYQPQQSGYDIGEIGYGCLKELDTRGLLAMYAENNELDLIEEELDGCMPGALEYTVKICRTDTCIIEKPMIETHVATYFVPGYTKPDPAMVRIWVS